MASLARKLGMLFQIRFQKIREINRKYAHPRLRTSKMVRTSLFLLRIYLIAMVCIIIGKFITLIHS